MVVPFLGHLKNKLSPSLAYSCRYTYTSLSQETVHKTFVTSPIPIPRCWSLSDTTYPLFWNICVFPFGWVGPLVCWRTRLPWDFVLSLSWGFSYLFGFWFPESCIFGCLVSLTHCDLVSSCFLRMNTWKLHIWNVCSSWTLLVSVEFEVEGLAHCLQEASEVATAILVSFPCI